MSCQYCDCSSCRAERANRVEIDRLMHDLSLSREERIHRLVILMVDGSPPDMILLAASRLQTLGVKLDDLKTIGNAERSA